MAFVIRNLSVLAYANGFTLWHYKSARDTCAEMGAANYFADAADVLTGGDMIMIGAIDGAVTRVVTLAGAETVTVGPVA